VLRCRLKGQVLRLGACSPTHPMLFQYHLPSKRYMGIYVSESVSGAPLRECGVCMGLYGL